MEFKEIAYGYFHMLSFLYAKITIITNSIENENKKVYNICELEKEGVAC